MINVNIKITVMVNFKANLNGLVKVRVNICHRLIGPKFADRLGELRTTLLSCFRSHTNLVFKAQRVPPLGSKISF